MGSLKLKLPYVGVETSIGHYESGSVDVALLKKALLVATARLGDAVASEISSSASSGPVSGDIAAAAIAASSSTVTGRTSIGSSDTVAFALGASVPIVACFCLQALRLCGIRVLEGPESSARTVAVQPHTA